jgi:hypothetical protein
MDYTKILVFAKLKNLDHQLLGVGRLQDFWCIQISTCTTYPMNIQCQYIFPPQDDISIRVLKKYFGYIKKNKSMNVINDLLFGATIIKLKLAINLLKNLNLKK